jgi:hypothetical protein
MRVRSTFGCDRCLHKRNKCDETHPRCTGSRLGGGELIVTNNKIGRSCVKDGFACTYTPSKERSERKRRLKMRDSQGSLPGQDLRLVTSSAELSNVAFDGASAATFGSTMSSPQSTRFLDMPLASTPVYPLSALQAGAAYGPSLMSSLVTDRQFSLSLTPDIQTAGSRLPLRDVSRGSLSSMGSTMLDRDFGSMRLTNSNANLLTLVSEPMVSPVNWGSDHGLLAANDPTSFASRTEFPLIPTYNVHGPQSSTHFPFVSPPNVNSQQMQPNLDNPFPDYSGYFEGQAQQPERTLIRELEVVTRMTWDDRLVAVMRDYRGYTQTMSREREQFLSSVPQRLETITSAHDLSAGVRSLMFFGLAHLSIVYGDSELNVMILLGYLENHHANNAQYYDDPHGQLSMWLHHFMCKHGRHGFDDYGVCVCGAVV